MSTTQAQDRDLRLTVYNNDLGLVSDHRQVDAAKGRSTVEIIDVPARIDPTSVHLTPKGGGLRVIEQNFQYDLAGTDRILDKYLDQAVTLVLKEGDVKSGTLLSHDSSYLTLRENEGISLVRREEIIDLRLARLPEGLRTRPTLVWTLDSSSGGSKDVELSYLTGGLSWHAEYVAVTDEKDTQVDLAAWVSLENSSGATYPDAQLQLIAGDVNRVRPEIQTFGRGKGAVMSMDAAGADFQEESFFEYHLYTLERRTTIADRETKQVALFPTANSPVKKVYEYRGQRDPRKVSVVLELENREDRGLGMPLPAGTVRTYKKDTRGQLQFIGEDRIDHTPKNEKVRLRIGNAFDVVGERAEISQKRISDRVFESEVEIKIRNRKDEAIEVVVEEQLWGSWEILTGSHEHNKKDANTVEFRVPVGADKETVLRYTVRIGR